METYVHPQIGSELNQRQLKALCEFKAELQASPLTSARIQRCSQVPTTHCWLGIVRPFAKHIGCKHAVQNRPSIYSNKKLVIIYYTTLISFLVLFDYSKCMSVYATCVGLFRTSLTYEPWSKFLSSPKRWIPYQDLNRIQDGTPR